MKKIHIVLLVCDIIGLILLATGSPKLGGLILASTFVIPLLISAINGKQSNEGTR